jgi:hypothetical protein
LEEQSLVAEITTYTHHTKWTFDNVKRPARKQVKIVGQLMAERSLQEERRLSLFSGAAQLPAFHIWEIHPITQLDLCKARGGCTTSSPASDSTNHEPHSA